MLSAGAMHEIVIPVRMSKRLKRPAHHIGIILVTTGLVELSLYPIFITINKLTFKSDHDFCFLSTQILRMLGG